MSECFGIMSIPPSASIVSWAAFSSVKSDKSGPFFGFSVKFLKSGPFFSVKSDKSGPFFLV